MRGYREYALGRARERQFKTESSIERNDIYTFQTELYTTGTFIYRLAMKSD